MKSKRRFAVALSALLLMQTVCGCGGAASSSASSASASTDSTASKSSEKAVIVTDNQEFTHENGITRLAEEIYGDLDVEFSVLSEDEQERETQISSLRVEIMQAADRTATCFPPRPQTCLSTVKVTRPHCSRMCSAPCSPALFCRLMII